MWIFLVFIMRLIGRLLEGAVDLFVLLLRAGIRLAFALAGRTVAAARSTARHLGWAARVHR